MSTEVILAIIASVTSGVGFLTKYILNNRDKKRAEEIEERNKRRADIEQSIVEVKTEIKEIKRDLNKTQAIILACDKKDCPSKVLLAEYLNKKSEQQ